VTLTPPGAAGARTLPHDSLQPILRHILDRVAPVLLDDAGRQALLDCAGTCPDVLSLRSLGLELRLQGPATGDLVVATVPTAPDSPRGANDDNDSSAPAQNAFHADPFGVLSALAAISGASVDHTACYEFKSVLEALPGRAELFAAGVVLSRESRRAHRVAFRRFTARDVKPFLKAIGRKNAAKTLSPVAKALARPSTDLCISLDLSPESDGVGLEVYADSSLSAGDAMGWEALLTALVDRNLADADRANAALGLLNAGREEHPRTGLSHVTITTADGALAPTKVYLADLT
jgi:hypothetical protein